MTASKNQSGFTAVELLITLFVAAAFLIASYQLFNLIIKDGGATRSQSRAANVAYDYLRQYTASSTTIPCTTSSPLNDAPLTVDGLSNVAVNVTVTCPSNTVNSLSKVEVDVTYNNPTQTVVYAAFTSSAGSSNGSDITNGLVAWWKLNGDANTSVGSPNGVITNAVPAVGQNGTAQSAYSFNGSSSIITTNSNFSLGTTNVTISCWIYNPSSSNHGMFIHAGYTSGYGIGIGNTTTDTNGSKLVMIYENVRWIPTSTTISTGWHHVVMVIDGSGVPTAYLDGVSTGSYGGGVTAAPNSNVTTIGGLTGTTADDFNGSVDDVRIYNRALPLADILTLYSNGAQ